MSDKDYRHLDYTYAELESLLSFLTRLKNEESRTLTKDEYYKVLDALKFIEEFNGDYENLTSKPQIPTRLSQLENDRNFSEVDYDMIEEWIERAIWEAEEGFQDEYVSNSSMENKYNDLFHRLDSWTRDINLLLNTVYATKDYVKESAYKLEKHEHSPEYITSFFKKEGFTLEHDLETLSNKIDHVYSSLNEHGNEYRTLCKELDILKSTVNMYKELYNSVIAEIQTKIDEEILNNHDHDDRYALKDDQHTHANKKALDVLDDASMLKWDATTKFVGNISTIILDGQDEGKFLEGWASANNRVTKCECGGITVGTDLRGKSISEMLKMMLYPDEKPTMSVAFNPDVLTYEIGKDNEITIESVVVTAVKGFHNISSIEVYDTDDVLRVRETDAASGGTFELEINKTFSSETALEIESPYRVKLEDAQTNTIIEYLPSINFCYPVFYGTANIDEEITADKIFSFDKIVNKKQDNMCPYTVMNQHMVYVYPVEFGELSSIKDTNGFDIIRSYEHTTIVLNINGTEVEYFVYKSNANTNIDFKVTYKFE